MKKKLLFIAVGICVVFGLFIVATFYTIYSTVKTTCTQAMQTYDQPCINSLIQVVQSSSASLKEKNTAIWALGQLADPAALPFLYQVQTQIPLQEKCDHTTTLCLYEINKAITWCEQGNVTSWMYKQYRY